ncbi:hypothetical protein GRI75_09680 [Altererythrobacter soli]|uniref:TonB-dependent receptor n=1 Tax=Croceibacterium soli TaxID=1739690 RepID=A0A6I4UVU5_9SPHN|nr:hypothetical protein [Croceibacterium soli]MXP41909.1 hypothetical protein [Croceibacterium soli]
MIRTAWLGFALLGFSVPAAAQDAVADAARDVSDWSDWLAEDSPPIQPTAEAADVADLFATPPTTDAATAAPGALSTTDLKEQRGRYTIVVGEQTLTAITAGGELNGGYTAGSVAISDQAFSNFHGLGNVLVNTGAFSTLQGGVNLVINVDGGL